MKRFVWSDKEGIGQNSYMCFRKTIHITEEVLSAELNMFADTHYLLHINGQFIEFGPVRFDPRFPVYDTHDISEHLVKGKNVVAILVNNIEYKTFKTIPNRAGFIAWGSVKETSGKEIFLETEAGSWKCNENKAYRKPTPKISFALNRNDLFDQSLEEENWIQVDFDDSKWMPCVEIEKQYSWGNLEKRRIPFMSGKNIPIEGIRVNPIVDKLELYSFQVPTEFIESPDVKINNQCSKFVCYRTWIYSEREQDVHVYVNNQNNWVNHDKVEEIKSVEITYCFHQKWHLQQGWNYYFGYSEANKAVFEHYIGFPKGKGIHLSCEKKENDTHYFEHSKIIEADIYKVWAEKVTFPLEEANRIEEIGGWIASDEANIAQNALIEHNWCKYQDTYIELSGKEISNQTFFKKEYPDGFTIFMDLKTTHLAFPIIELKNIENSIVDFIYGEKLYDHFIKIREREDMFLGDRVLCSRNAIKWQASHPRGFRYLQINVRNTKGDVVLKSLNLRSANYPVDDRLTEFNCSSPLFNSIWDLCKRTQIANMEDAYDDCMGRERGMYIRDTIIQYHNNLALFGDHELMRRCLQLYTQGVDDYTKGIAGVYPISKPIFLSDFSLNLVEGFYNYYEYTNDTSLILESWEMLYQNLLFFFELSDEREDGLLDAEWNIKRGLECYRWGVLIDNERKLMVETDDGPKLIDRTGINAIFTLFYYIALVHAEKLAALIGKDSERAELKKRIKLLSNTIPKRFWNADKKCFNDTLEGKSQSIYTQALFVRAGLLEQDKKEAIAEFLKSDVENIFVNGYGPEDGHKVSPHFAFYILDSLYKLELAKEAEHLMRQICGWMLEQNLVNCAEFVGLHQSLCHAWSASPLYFLSQNVLGISFPNRPDMNTVKIKIKAESIDAAEGSCPHPKGLIKIKWHTENHKKVIDYCNVPEGVRIVYDNN